VFVPRAQEASELVGGPGVEGLHSRLGLLQGRWLRADGGGDRQPTAVYGVAEGGRQRVVDVAHGGARQRAAAGGLGARLPTSAAPGVVAVALEVGVEGVEVRRGQLGELDPADPRRDVPPDVGAVGGDGLRGEPQVAEPLLEVLVEALPGGRDVAAGVCRGGLGLEVPGRIPPSGEAALAGPLDLPGDGVRIVPVGVVDDRVVGFDAFGDRAVTARPRPVVRGCATWRLPVSSRTGRGNAGELSITTGITGLLFSSVDACCCRSGLDR
jgi:hypothetical protein